jgi:formate dehydrogenase alpha subunit
MMLQADRVVHTTCPYCGVGCQIDLQLHKDVIFRVDGRFDNRVNFGNLCVKGRFGYDYVHAPDRLKRPLLRPDRSQAFNPTSWDHALDFVAGRLGHIRDTYGPDSVAILASAKCTNEENYLMQKFTRAVIGTNNVDHCARLCHASSMVGLATTLGSGAMTNSIADIPEAELLLVIGSNTTESHPVISLQMKKAVRRYGAKLVLIDPRRIELADFAHLHLRQKSGSDVALINALVHVIISEGLQNQAFIEARTENYPAFAEAMQKWTPERAEAISGVPAEQIVEAARLYATARSAAIFWAMGITQHTSGTDNVMALSNLALLTGHIGRPGTGLNPLRGQNNVQGASDMAALPSFFPGYQALTDPAVRQKFATAWEVPETELSLDPGLTVTEIMNAALDGQVKAIYIMGENPMLTDPNLTHVEEALRRVEFLAVQDIFLNETGQLAHVVLPAAGYAEKLGTFTNTERRVQMVRPALDPPGEARQDWQIIMALANRLGADWSYDSPVAIFQEMADLTPQYAGMSHARLEENGLQWPCPSADHPGTPILHTTTFARGLGLFRPVEHRPPAEETDEEYPFILSTGRILYHWHGGTLSRRSPGLAGLGLEAEVEIHPDDAERLALKPGEPVRVASRRGQVKAVANVTRRSPPGTVFMTFHFAEAAVNLLTIDAVDPMAKIPEYKVCAVKVMKA